MKPCPTRHPRHQPGTRVDGREGDSLTTKTGGQRLSHLHPAPTIAPGHPQAWLLCRNKKRGPEDGWGLADPVRLHKG